LFWVHRFCCRTGRFATVFFDDPLFFLNGPVHCQGVLLAFSACLHISGVGRGLLVGCPSFCPFWCFFWPILFSSCSVICCDFVFFSFAGLTSPHRFGTANPKFVLFCPPLRFPVKPFWASLLCQSRGHPFFLPILAVFFFLLTRSAACVPGSFFVFCPLPNVLFLPRLGFFLVVFEGLRTFPPSSLSCFLF